ncbi:MAG: hypothetical protein LBV04_09240 [Deferribacteraceae bacterium]|jgi:hypothetical protein|nr:hypothetical protein [Deferribacteraceae bacterium]
MKTLLLAISLLLINACAASKTEQFYFNSNANNVLVTLDGNSCYTPCALEIQDDQPLHLIVSYADNLEYHLKSDNMSTPSGFNSDEWWDSMISAPSDGMGLLGAVITTAPTTTTVRAIANSNKIMSKVLRYEQNAYYIYWESPNSAYFMDDSDLVDYALSNFEVMKQELFYTDRPFTDALISETGIQDIPNMLSDSTNALEFLDSLVLTQVDLLMRADLPYQHKMALLSELLWYDEETLSSLYQQSPEEFLTVMYAYLEDKRTLIDVECTDFDGLFVWLYQGRLGEPRCDQIGAKNEDIIP